MAEAQEIERCSADARRAHRDTDARADMSIVAAAPNVRGWESLKAALRQLVGGERGRTVSDIASTA